MLLDELYIDKPINPQVAADIAGFQRDYNSIPAPTYTMYANLRNDFEAVMKKRGWNLINYGSFSHVFGNPSEPYILKVNYKPDRAFAWFAFLTHKFPNKHFPKISAMKAISLPPQKISDIELSGVPKRYAFIYAIERLNEAPYDIKKSVSWPFNEYTRYSSVTLNDVKNYLEEHWSPEDIVSLLEALTIITINNNRKFKYDLHIGNFMQRADGTLVIIDPYVGEGTKSKSASGREK